MTRELSEKLCRQRSGSYVHNNQICIKCNKTHCINCGWIGLRYSKEDFGIDYYQDNCS